MRLLDPQCPACYIELAGLLKKRKGQFPDFL